MKTELINIPKAGCGQRTRINKPPKEEANPLEVYEPDNPDYQHIPDGYNKDINRSNQESQSEDRKRYASTYDYQWPPQETRDEWYEGIEHISHYADTDLWEERVAAIKSEPLSSD